MRTLAKKRARIRLADSEIEVGNIVTISLGEGLGVTVGSANGSLEKCSSIAEKHVKKLVRRNPQSCNDYR